jgi:large subunit ribosomal protein L32e
MKKPKFLRRTWSRFSKLGKRRKKLQKWRRPTGRDNKMREKRQGYPAVVAIGYRQEENKRGKIGEKEPVKIMNIKDLEKIGKNQIGIVGSVGKKRKIDLAKVAKERKIELANLNANKLLRRVAREKKKAKTKKFETKKTEVKKEFKENKVEEKKDESKK